MTNKSIQLTPSLKELIKHIKNGHCILFLGAGVHAPPSEDSPFEYPEEQRPPLGAALCKILAEKYGYNEQEFPQESCHDLQRVSLYVEITDGLGRKVLVDTLNDYLRVNKMPSPALKMLASLPFSIFVTTNYDSLLEKALREWNKDPICFVYNPNEEARTPDITEDPTEDRPLLFKMHGDLDQRNSIVITDEDYIRFVQRMSDKDSVHPVPQTVRFRMQKWPTLFVGYSLRDYNLRLLFRTLRWRVDAANFPTSYSVDRNPDPLTLQVWQNTRKFVSFVAQDIWTFAPLLYEQVHGKEFKE